MTLTVTKNLDTVCPVDNPMTFTIGTDNHLSVHGVKASETMIFSVADTSNKNLSISWGEISLHFYTCESPDESGLQLHRAAIGQSASIWVLILAEDLLKNYYVSRDFRVSVVESDKIQLTAKSEGSGYTLSISSSITGFSLTSPGVDGADPVLRDFYGIMARVLDATGSTIIGEDLVAPDPFGKSSFDIHDLLCDFLTPEFTWPQPAGELCRRRDKFVREFIVRYAETYDRSVKKLTALSGNHHAILGGFDYKMLAALNGSAYSMMDFIVSFKAFLTWSPTTKLISKTQREKLFYLVFDNIKVINSFVKINFTDGTSSAKTLIGTHAVDQYKVYEFFTGYEALGIASLLGGKTALKYEFWLEDDSLIVKSQVRTYEIDFRTYPYERTFIFRNSFGSYEMFRATGRKKHVNKYERMVLERNVSETAVTELYQVLESETFHVNTGYISRATKNWLREMMLSEDVREIIGDYVFPILIQNQEVENYDDLETIYDLDISYKYAFKNPKYSDQVNLLPLLAENLNALLSEDGQTLFS
jgi:hypothetical protein